MAIGQFDAASCQPETYQPRLTARAAVLQKHVEVELNVQQIVEDDGECNDERLPDLYKSYLAPKRE